VSEGIGVKLRRIRHQWQLSLREVQERSRSFAQLQGDQSYQVSASWLARLEGDDHELTVKKLIALADVYGIPAEQMLRLMYTTDPQPVLRRLASPTATMLLTEDPLEEQTGTE
jgi:transcriptional regulator with XRE-family HTH domain